ncbi:MAG: glycoside hydrolase [Desulfobacteraceae bacterium 4572_35.1]|nr:MAG: glycoside hydrolase [Desulfobacteraceae bacterium 4572_35.1]
MTKKLKVVLCWHMHQPYYRDGLDGEYRLPWVYLHAIKDYADMAAHLESFPAARVVVNFAPVLLEQLDDYGHQMRAWLKEGTVMSDPLLNLVSGEIPVPPEPEARAEIIMACQRAYTPHAIDGHAPFRMLVDIALEQYTDGELDTLRISYLNRQFFVDLLMWYHLAWLGASIKHKDTRVIKLMRRKTNFTRVDQILLIEVMAEIIEGIIPRYRALMESGRIELSMSPYGHPIVPLLLDFEAARAAQPDVVLPNYLQYPGGKERALWHLRHGLEVFENYFGRKPEGVWLSEGGVSSEALALTDKLGLKWTASGEGVWRGSCELSDATPYQLENKRMLYCPLLNPPYSTTLFFRDDGLSDLIGFRYKDWNAHDAANDFCRNLENIAGYLKSDVGNQVVTVILDGENAWEYYPDNAFEFLQQLYRNLTEHPQLEMTTFKAVVEEPKRVPVDELAVLRPGSWVYGSFSTWIGDKDKNRAWDMLVEAKNCYDRVVKSGLLSADKIAEVEQQLAVCEGSDWFWWFSEHNPAASVSDFDQLFRRHLIRLYQLLEKIPPQKLKNPLSHGGGGDVVSENAGTMHRN